MGSGGKRVNMAQKRGKSMNIITRIWNNNTINVLTQFFILT